MSLVRAACSGDGDAFVALIGPLLPTLRSRVRSAVRHRPEIDTDEVVADVLHRSFRSLDLFDSRHTFAQYFFGIAKYAIRRHAFARGQEVAVAWSDAESEETGTKRLPGADEIPLVGHDLVGVSRFVPPDECVQRGERFCALLRILLTYGGYPHQQIAFGYSVMLWGRAKTENPSRAAGRGERLRQDKVEVVGDPTRVVSRLSDAPLDFLGEEFRSEIEVSGRLYGSDLGELFHPFTFRLGLTGGDLFARDSASSTLFAHVADLRIGTTLLKDYYGRNPRHSVAEWSRAVKDRVRKIVAGEADLTRSVLPMPSKAANQVPAPTC